MDNQSRFAARYKADMSIENLRAKVARRKSLTQKENRHKEFRKSRGLALVDMNVSVKEQELTVLEEVNETFSPKASVNKTAPLKNGGNIRNERRLMLQRFKEEKELRKLKEQREKASKGAFKCGIYRPETSFIPVFTSQQPPKSKPKDKPAPLAPVTRVTRSATKIEAPVHNLRSRPAQVPVLNNKVPDLINPRGRGQTSVLKKNEKENKATAIPLSRTTRATAATTTASRLPAVKGGVKNVPVLACKPQRAKETSAREIASTKPKKKEKVEPEVAMPAKVEPEVAMPAKVEPEVAMPAKVEPEVAMPAKVEPEVAMPAKVEPEVAMPAKVEPEVAMPAKVEPEVAMPAKVEPEVAMPAKVEPEVAMPAKVEPEVAMPAKVEPEVAMPAKVEPVEVTAEESGTLSEIKTSLYNECKPSFAPENFVFQPLDGLSTFKFQPMTPKRADAFLTPTFTWSPVEGKSHFVFTRDCEENKTPNVSPPDLSLKTTNVEMDTCTSPETKDVSSKPPVGEEVPPECDQNTCMPVQSEEVCHDVPYFRALLESEIQRLTVLCTEWEKRLDQDIPEDSKDVIRTTVGQSRLLMTERFKQFRGLVDNCEFKLGEKETTCTDLDGFWDMIYFQVEDVTKKFVNLGKMEENSWQQTSVQTKKVVRKKPMPAVTVNKSQGDNARAAARSRLAAIKAAMRNRVKQEEVVEEATVSEQPMQVDPVVFDAGFFRIESPAKLPGSIRTKTPSQTSTTPKSIKKVRQNSDPVADGKEGNVGHLHIQKSPNAAKSPVRKALFDTEEESLQNQEHKHTKTDNTESETVPQVVDLSIYLVPSTTVTESVANSPVCIEFSRLDTEGTELVESTHLDISSTVVDVLMSSPEKVPETKLSSPKNETEEILLDEDPKIVDDPLDFLGNSTADMLMHTPLKSEVSVAAVSDLIVFSPMEF